MKKQLGFLAIVPVFMTTPVYMLFEPNRSPLGWERLQQRTLLVRECVYADMEKHDDQAQRLMTERLVRYKSV